MQLDWTRIYAPTDGYIESFNMDVGYYCQAGKPITTLVSKEDLWIQADFKENNLSNMKIGDKVEFILDVVPGKVFRGKVRSIGYGVDAGNKMSPGDLPKISSKNSWLQDPQRFPVIISMADTAAIRICRAGGQADVVVYTGDHALLNAIAKLRIRINTWLSYVR
jgi:multidrug resistance efflux pump